MNQSKTYPMFPLGLVLFPGETLNLHIFEPRYKALINECDRNKDTLFGIPPYFVDKPMTHGTLVKLNKIVNRYPDGRMDIVVESFGLFEIEDFYMTLDDKPYPGATVRLVEIDQSSDLLINIQLVDKLNQLYKLMNIKNIKVSQPEEFKTYQVVHKVGYTLDQELELLTFTQEIEKAIYMLNHLEILIEQAALLEEIRKRAELNGHFQHIDSML